MDFKEFIAKVKDIIPDVLIQQGVNYLDNLIVYAINKMPVEKQQELGRIAAVYLIKVLDRNLGEEGAENVEDAIQDFVDNIVLGFNIECDLDDEI